ncbi:PfkB family carbohydrate kinase [Budvicia diplopodorum]|uniref:PfkB family carbohydrate kinase n=1 Tax=Budvicia diplopodorum TaxID=1119056 RepID=UPI001357EB0A|nr:PfkB family carbohydrate kinase [Budvicia diplopodorum]
MTTTELISKLPSLANRRPVCVVGAAVIDVIADAYSLPHRGSDIELHQQGVNIGGCALNIAIALHRLGMESLNALPMGQGIWADIIRKTLAENGIVSAIETDKGDNGWCLALVEPDGERTFLSISGVENQWDRQTLDSLSLQPNTLVYLSGYQLSSSGGEVLISWMESLPQSIEIFIDFGPRISDLSAAQLSRLMARRPIVSLNRQEAEYIVSTLSGSPDAKLNTEMLAEDWFQRYASPLIIRVDKEGAYYHDGLTSGWVAPFSATVVDTIGAGDSHAGGVLAGLASGWPLADAVTLGNAVASYVVSHRGGDCAPYQRQLIGYLAQY